ncbi:MAG: FAD binding domain-containing protein [Candidatus Riflebacteria bacterium]|nr:FAD binding domain-containing protein [Candidatus Riflebacteria bacterium]
MLKKLKNFFRPKSVEEACSLLREKNSKNVLLAGGTNLAVTDDSSIEGLVDLKNLGLSYLIIDEKHIKIGAMTRIQEILKSSELKCPSGLLLKKASSLIGSTLLRNSITAGGNTFAVFPWSDLPPVMLALDAEFVVDNGPSQKVYKAVDFYRTRPSDVMQKDELLREILIPTSCSTVGTAFHKVAKTRNDFSMITVAVKLSLDVDKVIQDIRIALNAVCQRPMRCLSAEEFLKGKKAQISLFADAGKKALESLPFTSDFRASKEYREEVLPIFVKRCLAEACKMIDPAFDRC